MYIKYITTINATCLFVLHLYILYKSTIKNLQHANSHKCISCQIEMKRLKRMQWREWDAQGEPTDRLWLSGGIIALLLRRHSVNLAAGIVDRIQENAIWICVELRPAKNKILHRSGALTLLRTHKVKAESANTRFIVTSVICVRLWNMVYDVCLKYRKPMFSH